MTDYDYYWEYSDDVDAKIQEISDKVQEGVEYILGKWEDTIGSQDWMWFVSPGVKIAYEIAKGNLEDEIQRLWDGFTDACEDMWEKVET